MIKFMLMGLLLVSGYSYGQDVNQGTGSKISAADAQKVLAHHNMARKEVGVADIAWSNELAAVAQQWANHLASTGKFQHSTNNDYGENIFMGSSTYTPLDASVSWYSEIKDYTYSPIGSVGKTGHYTQIIWQNTTHVGVGVAIAANGYIYVVANYSPAGNYTGQYPYKK